MMVVDYKVDNKMDSKVDNKVDSNVDNKGVVGLASHDGMADELNDIQR